MAGERVRPICELQARNTEVEGSDCEAGGGDAKGGAEVLDLGQGPVR